MKNWKRKAKKVLDFMAFGSAMSYGLNNDESFENMPVLLILFLLAALYLYLNQ